MASLSLYSQFETNLMSNRKVIELLLQLKSAKAHGNTKKSQTTAGPPSGFSTSSSEFLPQMARCT